VSGTFSVLALPEKVPDTISDERRVPPSAD
jgi:hypothetical protein